MNAWNDEGYDALYFAADSSQYECVDILLKAGADVNNRTDDGETALLAAVTESNTNDEEKDRVKTVNILIKAGADVNIKNKRDQTTLFYASDYMCMNMLVEAGADVNITDYNGNNALHFLVNLDNDDKDYADYAKNYRQNVKRFLRAGIHINTFNKSQGKNVLAILLHYKYKYRDLYETADEIYYKDPMKLLYAAGETLDGTEEEKIPEVLKFEDEKLELKHICREAIRKHLLKLDPHQHLFGRVPRLGLPSILTEYLLFNQSLETSDSDDDDDSGDDNDPQN